MTGLVVHGWPAAEGFPPDFPPRPLRASLRRCTHEGCSAFVSRYNYSSPPRCWCHSPAPRPSSSVSVQVVMEERSSVC
jgi:hypothetical protein